MPTRKGSIRLFRLFGITAYLHWSWFLIAYFVIRYRMGLYSSPVWSVLEYVALFLIVLIHEFGHQLACRSVGGQTHDIVLFPFGGVAYVTPPQRPGAQLWSIAAGPLVNVMLIPVLTLLLWSLGGHPSVHGLEPNQYAEFLNAVWFINVALLIFNMVPIYPLDGGQILRSLLWFVMGRANSLLVASIIGFIGVGGLFLLAGLQFLLLSDTFGALWLAAISVFILMNCWNGLTHARAMAKIANAPRHPGFACPACHTPPPRGGFWHCGNCRQPFDFFETQGVCPNCGTQFAATSCLECGALRPINEWMTSADVPPRL